MAIALEFIDFVVPIALIRQKYPGGWDDGAPYRADIRFDLSPEEAEDFARELKQWCAKPDAFVWKGD